MHASTEPTGAQNVDSHSPQPCLLSTDGVKEKKNKGFVDPMKNAWSIDKGVVDPSTQYANANLFTSPPETMVVLSCSLQW
uniref:Uncharacterized protein n=1 Tax=Nelumbo nucifera TaxID=4432 RepID=A0A822XZV6_NELNU|nr:TPA_asm: hypothetical protein HUJ06_027215 [Nelumbo nucifera]